jgi:hypothetical protein
MEIALTNVCICRLGVGKFIKYQQKENGAFLKILCLFRFKWGTITNIKVFFLKGDVCSQYDMY